jgi:lipopolysaccharide biosynthesis regulator YciM
MGALYQSRGDAARALESFRIAARTFDRDAATYVASADAAFKLGRPALADSLLTRAEQICYHCWGLYRTQALAAQARGDSAVADSLRRRVR